MLLGKGRLIVDIKKFFDTLGAVIEGASNRGTNLGTSLEDLVSVIQELDQDELSAIEAALQEARSVASANYTLLIA